ncbi:MAG: ABC transporter ATP-binding protein [Acetobacteraceae bacterium]|nr:ABC transporter ATP-binding protein [Acetobacteraceae bacterium]
MTAPVLEVRDLTVAYRTAAGEARAVDSISFSVAPGQYLGIVGESGCGKSTIAKAILGILPDNARTGGAILHGGQNLLTLDRAALNRVRWRRIAMVPQSAMHALDPVRTVGAQIAEAIDVHAPLPRDAMRARLDALFELVGLASARLGDFPHQLSGGMRQRAMIAMAMALDPDLIVADEPTTGLDVIVQDQILLRIKEIQERLGKTMLLITHDIAVVSESCDQVVVMYAGRIMERGSHAVLDAPFHPYTVGLINAFPDLGGAARELISIPGAPPSLIDPPRGCRFQPRCPFAVAICAEHEPALREVAPGHLAACHRLDDIASIRAQGADPATWRG